MKIRTAKQAREELESKQNVEVPDHVFTSFEKLIDDAIAQGKNQIDHYKVSQLCALLNQRQRDNFYRILENCGYKRVQIDGDPREHLSYDFEYWEF